MPKKKKTQNQGGPEAPVNEVFSEAGAAQGAAAVNQAKAANQATSQEAAPAVQTASQGAAQPRSQIPPDLAELVRSTLTVLVAQRRTHGLAITLTAMVKSLKKALEKYLRHVLTYDLREFVKNELVSMGYPVINAVVEYKGGLYSAEVVVLYRNFDEVLDMIKKGRMNTFLKSLISNEVMAPFDKLVKHV